MKENVDKISIEVQKTCDKAGGKPTLVSHFNTKHLVLWTTKSECHVMPLSALSTMSVPSVQTVIKFTNWIPKIMVQFCYSRLYFGIDNVSRRLLQWIARIKNGLKLRPTTRYRTYSNQISTRLRFRSDNESAEEGDLWSSLWQDMHDHVGKISTRTCPVRLDLFWLHDLYFQFLTNCTSGQFM